MIEGHIYMFFEDIERKIWVLTPSGITKMNGTEVEKEYPYGSDITGSRCIVDKTGKYIEFRNSYLDSVLFFDIKKEIYFKKINDKKEGNIINFYLSYRDGVVYNQSFKYENQSEIQKIEREKTKRFWLERFGKYKSSQHYQNDTAFINDITNTAELRVTAHSNQGDNHILIKKKNEPLLIYYDLEKGSKKEYKLDASWHINSIILDKSKNIWLATEQGLYKLYNENISYYDKTNGLPSMPWSVQEDNNGNYIVGSYNQHAVYKLKKGTTNFEKINQKYLSTDRYMYFGAKKTKQNEVVLPTDYGAFLWKNNVFLKLDDYSDVFERSATYFISHTDMLLDDIAIGGVDRFVVYDSLRNVKAYLLRKDIDPKNLLKEKANLNVLEIEKLNDTIYFLGLNCGYLLYDISSKKIKTYSFYEHKPTTKYDAYYSAAIDYRGTLWSAARTNDLHGLYKYNQKEDTFERVFENLLDGRTETVATINDNKILLASTLTSLVVIDLERYYKNEGNYFYVLNKNNGFEVNEPTQNSLTQDSKGNVLVLTGDEKLYKFKLDSSVFNLPKHEVEIGKIEVFDKNSFNWHLFDKSFSDTLVFNKEIRSLRFLMSGVTQNSPSNLVYAFRFKKGDKEWTDWKETDAYFTIPDFPVGTSQLQVACYYFFDTEKLEGKPIKTFYLVFEPFWYELFLVQLLLVIILIILIGASLYLFIRNRKKGIELKQNFELIANQNKQLSESNRIIIERNLEIEHQKEEIDTQNQHLTATNEEINWLKNSLEHDLGNDLGRLKELGEINIKKLIEPKKANHFENLQSSLIATINYYVFMTELNKSERKVEDLLFIISKNILKKYNRENQIQIQTHSNLDVNQRKERKAINKIMVCVAELIRNTLKYAFPVEFLEKNDVKPTIQIDLVKENSFVFIRYQDNGVGIQEEKKNEKQTIQGTGIGFLLLQDTSYKDDFVWKNKEEGGFFVQLKLKMQLDEIEKK